MEPYPNHYSRQTRTDEPSVDPNLCFVLDELQKMETRLGDRIEGRCSDIGCRVVEFEQHVEERFISLEMARTKADQGRSVMEQQFDDLKLEVH
jgi:hypothetical protein